MPSRPPPAPSSDVVFAPRRRSRTAVGVVLLVLGVATAVAAWQAYRDPSSGSVGLAGTLFLGTAAVYAVRAGGAPTTLAIRSGQLELVRSGRRDVVDLRSRFTTVEVVGRPGRPGWRVLLGRPGRDPVVVDASMVDPQEFTEALARNGRR